MVHLYDIENFMTMSDIMVQFYQRLLKMAVKIENVSDDKTKLASPYTKVKGSSQLKRTETLKLKLVNLSLQSQVNFTELLVQLNL